MSNVFITGITGMVGSHLADYLLENTDWEIFGFLRWDDDLKNLRHLSNRINQKDRISLIYGDLNDTSSIIQALTSASPDYIYHLAAQSYPQTSFIAPIDTLSTNILGTCRLLESIKNVCSDAKVHVCASSEVFGRVDAKNLPIDEECSFHPASPYAISKVGTDLLGRYYAEAFGIHIQTTRMFTHTGPRRGDVFAESTFAKQLAMIEAKLIPPVVKTGNLESLRTYADVRDAVRAYHMLLTVNPIAGAYYNIGGTHVVKVKGVLDALIKISGLKNIKIEAELSRMRPIDADLQVPDTTKFSKHTGWKPEIDFLQTMNDLYEYWRNEIKIGNWPINR
jgi:GDP-mannose 4,6-dehydratase